jgi:hypothetical protein
MPSVSSRGGQGKPPKRRLNVAFLGAGSSKAAGLPLTEELLERIWPREGKARWKRRRSQAVWRKDLQKATQVLYPSGGDPAFRPSVSDFFTVLEVIESVHAGRARLPLDARGLLDDLRSEIGEGLLRELDRTRLEEVPHTAWLMGADRPDVVVTSNWDSIVETVANASSLAIRFAWPRSGNGPRRSELRKTELVVLKLHGSVDWGYFQDRLMKSGRVDKHYAGLSTLVGEPAAAKPGRRRGDTTLRFRALEGSRTANGSSLGFKVPLMATMAFGKHPVIDALSGVWDDAYWCLSRATRLDIVGYSFPADDLELRTLLRTTSRKAGGAELDPQLAVRVCNPSPEAHERARSFLGSDIDSDYRGTGVWTP